MTFSQLALQASQDFWQGSFDHPFIKELQDGSLDREVFRYYLLQDRYYLKQFARLSSLVAERAGDSPIGDIMRYNLQAIAVVENTVRQPFFDELGITEEEIAQTPIAPTCYHYVSHMYRQLAEDNIAIVYASMLPCPWLYLDIGVELNKTGSPYPIYQSWIETYATDELKDRVAEEHALINDLYEKATPEEQKKMLDAFIISTKMEYAFWEMSYKHEDWTFKKD